MRRLVLTLSWWIYIYSSSNSFTNLFALVQSWSRYLTCLEPLPPSVKWGKKSRINWYGPIPWQSKCQSFIYSWNKANPVCSLYVSVKWGNAANGSLLNRTRVLWRQGAELPYSRLFLGELEVPNQQIEGMHRPPFLLSTNETHSSHTLLLRPSDSYSKHDVPFVSSHIWYNNISRWTLIWCL